MLQRGNSRGASWSLSRLSAPVTGNEPTAWPSLAPHFRSKKEKKLFLRHTSLVDSLGKIVASEIFFDIFKTTKTRSNSQIESTHFFCCSQCLIHVQLMSEKWTSDEEREPNEKEEEKTPSDENTRERRLSVRPMKTIFTSTHEHAHHRPLPYECYSCDTSFRSTLKRRRLFLSNKLSCWLK